MAKHPKRFSVTYMAMLARLASDLKALLRMGTYMFGELANGKTAYET